MKLEDAFDYYYRGMIDAATYLLEPIEMIPVKRQIGSDGYSFDGVDGVFYTLRIENFAAGAMWEDLTLLPGQIITDKFSGAAMNLRNPWDRMELVDPDSIPICPVCEENLIDYNDYLCAECRYGY